MSRFYRGFWLTLVFGCMLSSLYAQNAMVDLSAVDLEAVDFSSARLSIAGPGAFLIRSVKVEDDSYSIIFRENGGEWMVSEIIPETGDLLLPDNVILDFAQITATENGLRIDGILIDGESYSTTLSLDAGSLTPPSELSAAKLVGASLERISADAGLYTLDDINSQTTRIASLTERNTALLAQVGTLGSRVEDLESENDRLLDEMERLRSEKADLDTEVGDLAARLEALQLAAAASADESEVSVEDDETGAEGITEAAAPSSPGDSDLLLRRIDVLLQKIALLESSIAELESRIAEVPSAPAMSVSPGTAETAGTADTIETAGTAVTAGEESTHADENSLAEYLGRIRELEREISELRLENSRLSAERNAIEHEIRQRFLEDGFIATMLPQLTRVLHSGFDLSQEQIGSWNIENGVLMQENEREFFAKMEIPLPQENQPTLYRFGARSRGTGWTGFGVHIFADRVEKRGYGYGESLLIWITRDPEQYGTNRSYLEIYRSSDDINMARVLSAALPDDSAEWMDIDLLYQPQDEYITVAVNGVERVRYRTWFGIRSGVSLALRTLDVAEFRDLQVLSP